MRHIRIIAAITLVFIAAFSAGCLNKSWLYDFTDPSASVNDWYTSSDGEPAFALNPTGLDIKDLTLCSPVSFTGDLTVTIYFDYSLSGDSECYLGIGLTSDVLGYESSVIELNLLNPGSANVDYPEGWYYLSVGPKGYYMDMSTGAISGFVINGINEVELALKGDKLDVSINGSKLHSGNAAHFERISSHLLFWGNMDENASMEVKRVEVRYGGELIEENLGL